MLSSFTANLGEFHYDLIVIGGGPGGFSAAKEAAELGAKVALLDYVAPTPLGTKWGIGGTCVNVGCIPKKLMHEAALFGEALQDSRSSGWQIDPDIQHNWSKLKNAVQTYIKTVNCAIKVELARRKIVYYKNSGLFKDPHTIILKANSINKEITGKYILIAVGARAKYPDIPGDVKFGITSEDLFSLDKPPGKTLIIGAGYIGLECAGFLNGLHYDVTIMNRTAISLRRLDQSMATHVVREMEDRGVKFLHECEAKSITKSPCSGKLKCTWINGENEQSTEDFDTVLFAVGRITVINSLNLENAGIQVIQAEGQIETVNEQTNVPHIFAVGDVLHDKPQLTPIAIRAGKLLSRRLFGSSKEYMDYEIFGTALLTPLEYGAVGLSEDTAMSRFGEDGIEVYHAYYKPSRYLLTRRSIDNCYLKVVALREGTQKILGMHFLGPHAGEVIQGFVTAMRCGLTVDRLQNTVGIHITNAEEFIKLEITKRSGVDPKLTPCCS